MKYTAKDVCRMLNITRETLRYYEKVGIIHPEIDPVNKYRYYDDWDINYIYECKKYQSLGFSVKEVLEIFSRGSYTSFNEKIEEKQKEFLEKARFYSNLEIKNEHYLNTIRDIPETLGRCRLIETRETYFIPYRENFEYTLDHEKLKVVHQALDYYSFFDNTVYIDLKDYLEDNDRFHWGLSIEKRYAEFVEMSFDHMTFLPRRKAVYSIVDAGERWNFSNSLFDGMKAYAEERGLKPDGPVHANLLTRIFHRNRFARYLETYMPVYVI